MGAVSKQNYGGSTKNSKSGGSSCSSSKNSKSGGSRNASSKGGNTMGNAANLAVPFGIMLARNFLNNINTMKLSKPKPSTSPKPKPSTSPKSRSNKRR